MANGSTNPAPTPRAEQTARNKQARINRPEQIGPGIALVARRWRSRTPFSPDAGQRALPPRVPTACRGRALARSRLRGRRSGPEKRLRRAIVPGMPGPQHQATEAKPAQHVADAALGHHHPKVRLDRAHEVGPAPARHPIPRKLRALDDPAGYCLLLLSRQQAGGPATALAQSRCRLVSSPGTFRECGHATRFIPGSLACRSSGRSRHCGA